jgi:pilus assembly protein Flp/PilA
MNALIGAVRQFVRDEEGITAIEYGLIAALMAAALGTIFATLTGGLTTAFASIVALLNGA